MTLSITHPFHSAKADGVDATLVQPSAWNAGHSLSMATNKILGRMTAGTGVVEELAVTGTGNVVMSAAPTFTGSVGFDSIKVGGYGGSEAFGVTGDIRATGNITAVGNIVAQGGTISNGLGIIGFGLTTTYSYSNMQCWLDSDHTQGQFTITAADTGGVLLTARATSWVSASSRYYKKDIQPIPGSALDRAEKIHGRLYRLKTDGLNAPLRIGVIYEDVSKPDALPWAAHISAEIGRGRKKQKKRKTVSLEQHVPLLIECIHELRAELNVVKAKINTLKKKAK